MIKVPKLRFKEFSDEWEEKKLGEIAEITSGLTPLRSEEKFYLNGTIPWIKTSDLNNSYIKETEEKISEVALKETSIKLLPKNILLVAMYGGFNQIGRTGLTTMEATTNQALSAIKFKNINKFPLFFQNVLNYKVEYWKKVSASSRKDPNITKKDIENFKVFYPKLEEQEKIANFLSDVDKKIYLTEEKLELFKEYKKGIMQKIFSQELRFKDNEGNDYPEWEEKRLSEITECLDNLRKPLNSNEREKIKGIIPYYGANGIQGYINDYIFNEELVLLAEDGGNFDNYLIKPIAQYVQGKSWINNHAHVLKGKKILKTKFLYFSLVHKDIRSFINGTSRSKLNKSSMLNITILLPTLEEQGKIADFLSLIDTKVENIERELENLKEFKKGLLQQMFI